MAVISDTLVTVLEVQGLGAWSSAFGQMDNILGSMGGKVTAASQRWAAGAAAAAAGAGLLTAGIGQAVSDAAKMEQIKTAFVSLEGSAEGARRRIAELEEFDRKSPFDFEQIAKGAQLLRGFGASGDQVVPVMNAIGNAVSASGNLEGFPRAMLAVGQVISRGKLQGDELNQLAEAGVPVADMLRELGASGKDVGSMNISSDKFLAALIKVMNQPKFANAMADQSKTLAGRLATLRGEYFRLSAAIGESFLPILTPMVGAVAGVANAFNSLPGPVKGAAGLIAGGLVLALGAASIAMAVASWRASNATVAVSKLAKEYYGLAIAARTAGGAMNGPGGFPQTGPMGGGNLPGGGPGLWGKAKGFGGKALGFLGKFGLPAMLAWEGAEGLMEGSQSGDWGGAFKRFLWGDAIGGQLNPSGAAKPGSGPATDPVLEELRKQTELQSKQLSAMEGENSLPTDFIPLGIQRSMTKRFARAAR